MLCRGCTHRYPKWKGYGKEKSPAVFAFTTNPAPLVSDAGLHFHFAQ
jgi:hypothetical protein